jgi:hypothetical protein
MPSATCAPLRGKENKMSWQSFNVEAYELFVVAPNTQGFPEIYAFIRLHWDGKQRGTLWFFQDGTANIPANASFESGGYTNYYGRFRQGHFRECVDLLRNEKPAFFQWNDTTKGVFLTTKAETVGEGEGP